MKNDNKLISFHFYYCHIIETFRFLIKCRQREDGQLKISTLNLVDMAIQITLGIMYLHSQCICYKDLATRNCLYVLLLL